MLAHPQLNAAPDSVRLTALPPLASADSETLRLANIKKLHLTLGEALERLIPLTGGVPEQSEEQDDEPLRPRVSKRCRALASEDRSMAAKKGTGKDRGTGNGTDNSSDQGIDKGFGSDSATNCRAQQSTPGSLRLRIQEHSLRFVHI